MSIVTTWLDEPLLGYSFFLINFQTERQTLPSLTMPMRQPYTNPYLYKYCNVWFTLQACGALIECLIQEILCCVSVVEFFRWCMRKRIYYHCLGFGVQLNLWLTPWTFFSCRWPSCKRMWSIHFRFNAVFIWSNQVFIHAEDKFLNSIDASEGLLLWALRRTRMCHTQCRVIPWKTSVRRLWLR